MSTMSTGDSLMVKQINFIIVVRRIKILAIAIIVGITAIYFFGLLVADKNFKENFEPVNLLTLVFLAIAVPITLIIRKLLLEKVTLNNFAEKYFSAHIIIFAILDFAALFCLTTNLFVNGNILYATAGFVISLTGMFLNFPKEEDFRKISLKADLKEKNISSADTD